MNMKNLSVRRLVRCAVIAAVYVVVCLVLAPFSYGAVQVRVAEALCLLPVFGAEYIVGVTLGCFLANLLGSTVVDVVFGTLATLLACLVTYKLRDIRVKGLAIPASLPPVVFNMIIVGAFEITFFFSDGAPTAMLAVFNVGSLCRYCRHWRAHQLYDSGCGARQADRKQRRSEQNFYRRIRQHRTILSADTASEARQMLSKKRRQYFVYYRAFLRRR